MPLIRGSIDYDQILSTVRKGAGAFFQMFGGGSTTTGNLASYDANGNVIDSGVPKSGLPVSGTQTYNSRTISQNAGSATALLSDYLILADNTNTSTGVMTITLPLNPPNGQTYVIRNVSTVGTTFNVEVTATSPNTIGTGPVPLSGAIVFLSRPIATQPQHSVTLTFNSSTGVWAQSSGGLDPSGGIVPATLGGDNTFTGNNTIDTALLGTLGGWQAWTPTVTANASTVSAVSSTSTFLRIGPICYILADVTLTLSAATTAIYLTIPVAQAGSTNAWGIGQLVTGSVMAIFSIGFPSASQGIFVRFDNGSMGSGTVRISLAGFYRCA